MKQIFSDFEILRLVKDHEASGVLLKARKPLNWSSIDLSDVALYSMILGRRTTLIPEMSDMPLQRRLILNLKTKLIGIEQKLLQTIKTKIVLSFFMI
jgi:hypothetical protein